MRVMMVHNEYAKPSGEENAVRTIAQLLKDNGHDVLWHLKSSADIPNTLLGKASAFFSGMGNSKSRAEISQRLDEAGQLDIVQVQNLYPLLSPAILKPIRDRGLPIVMRCPNYRLFCPIGLHLSHEELCERCLGGREYWCALRNCTGSLPKSIGYALRARAVRRNRAILDNVTVFVVLSEFQRQRFIAGGIEPRRIGLLYNMAPFDSAETTWPAGDGDCISFVGRLSKEKGIEHFVQAARALPLERFEVAGDYSDMPDLVGSAPANIKFHGFLAGKQLEEFYRRTKIFAFCGLWFEGFPNVITRAMIGGKPVIATRIGSLPEIVTDGKTGLLYEPGNVPELVDRIRTLAGQQGLCESMGAAGREKARTQYSPQSIYKQLMQVYAQAAELTGRPTPAEARG